jgi:site-specific DNA-methyltransferase (adenine-specific)
MATRIAVGDARTKLRLIRSESVNCCITSPPYWMKRDYQAGPEELGREPTIQEYIDNLMGVIDEIHRVLMPHGTFWLNLGDSYVGNEAALVKGNDELPQKSLCLLPYRVAIAMIDRGWIVRNAIIWHKPDCLPESATDRFTADYEPVFLCTKNPQYYFKQQLRPYSEKTLKRCKSYVDNGEAFDPARHRFDPKRPSQAPAKVLENIAKNLMVPGRTTHTMHIDRANGNDREVFNGAGANMRCVWRIATAGYRGAHFAVFPEKLVEICIDAGCPTGGTVLDPFLGAGTVAVVAEDMGRTCYGIELNPEYAQQATERILAARTKRLKKAESPNGTSVVEPTVASGMVVEKELDRVLGSYHCKSATRCQTNPRPMGDGVGKCRPVDGSGRYSSGALRC